MRSMNLYFIRVKDTQIFKIGISRDVKGRLYALQGANPRELELFYCVPTTYAINLERTLHSHFNQYRMRNEWFNIPSEKVVECIDTIIPELLKSCKSGKWIRRKVKQEMKRKGGRKKQEYDGRGIANSVRVEELGEYGLIRVLVKTIDPNGILSYNINSGVLSIEVDTLCRVCPRIDPFAFQRYFVGGIHWSMVGIDLDDILETGGISTYDRSILLDIKTRIMSKTERYGGNEIQLV